MQKVAADKGIAVAMPSAGGAAGGAVVDSAALDAFAAKVTGADGVLASTAKFVLNQLGVAAPVAEETADENAAVVAAVEAELGADWPKQVEPRLTSARPFCSTIVGHPHVRIWHAPTTTTMNPH